MTLAMDALRAVRQRLLISVSWRSELEEVNAIIMSQNVTVAAPANWW